MFWLEAGLPNISTRNVVYICRPQMAHMRTIAGMPLAPIDGAGELIEQVTSGRRRVLHLRAAHWCLRS